MVDLERGIYEHYKGKYYQLLGVAISFDVPERYAIYRHLYRDQEVGEEELFFRPVAEFCELICWPDGVRRPRFRFISAEIGAEPRRPSLGEFGRWLAQRR